jgi:hypothetical protein
MCEPFAATKGSRSYFMTIPAGPIRMTVTFDPVALYLCIQGRVLDAEQPRGSGLVPTTFLQGSSNQFRFKSLHFLVEFQSVAACRLRTPQRVHRIKKVQRHLPQSIEAIVERCLA